MDYAHTCTYICVYGGGLDTSRQVFTWQVILLPQLGQLGHSQVILQCRTKSVLTFSEPLLFSKGMGDLFI